MTKENKRNKKQISVRELYNDDIMCELIDNFDSIHLTSLFTFDLDDVGEVCDIEEDFTVLDLIAALDCHEKGAAKYTIRPLINESGGLRAFNNIMKIVNIKYIVSKKDFVLLSDLYPVDIEESIERLLNYGFVDKLDLISIDNLVWLDIKREHVIKTLKERLGWTTLGDFYLMRTDKSIYGETDKSKLESCLRDVDRIKQYLYDVYQQSTGIRLPSSELCKRLGIKEIWTETKKN